MIYYNIPWNTNKDIGFAYNSFMDLLPNDEDYACFVDADAMFLTPFFGKQLEDIVAKYPECGLFTAVTNRVKSQYQLFGDYNSDNIAEHRKLAEELQQSAYFSIEDISNTSRGCLSGVLILIQKRLWKKLGGFVSGILGVDSNIHQRAFESAEKVYLMRGVYLYHWYRGGDSTKKDHLVGGKRVFMNKHQEILLRRSKQIEDRLKYQGKNTSKSKHRPLKKVIYSAITGEYDKPIVHDIPEGWEYRLYTNTKKIPGTHFVESHLSDRKLARYIKTMPWDFFDFDICLWIDGNTTFDKTKLEELCQYDFVISKHPTRDCIYDEGEAIKKFKKDNAENINRVLERYKREGFPERFGLVASHVILRRNTEENKKFSQDWWNEIKEYSYRDQMSFNYLLWKNPIKVHYIDFGTTFKATTTHRDKI